MDLCKFEYEIIENKSRWKASIICNNSEEGSAFLRKIVGKPISIFSIETIVKIDGITDEIINKILAIHDKLPEEKYEPIIKDPLKLTNNEKPTKKKMKRRGNK